MNIVVEDHVSLRDLSTQRSIIIKQRRKEENMMMKVSGLFKICLCLSLSVALSVLVSPNRSTRGSNNDILLREFKKGVKTAESILVSDRIILCLICVIMIIMSPVSL